MKKNTAIARKYAKALLLIGKEDNNAKTYGKELASFATLLEKETNFTFTISNPLYEVSVRKGILEAVLSKTEFSKIMQTFIILLFEKRRIPFAIEINFFYQKLLDEYEGFVRADVTSATKLTSDEVGKIQKAFEKKLNKSVILDVKEDSSIIGGLVAKIGDLVLDGSIKTQLLKIKENLKKGESV